MMMSDPNLGWEDLKMAMRLAKMAKQGSVRLLNMLNGSLIAHSFMAHHFKDYFNLFFNERMR